MPALLASVTDHAVASRLRKDLSAALGSRPTAHQAQGLRRSSELLETRLRSLRFEVRRVATPGGQDVLVALRAGVGSTIGLTGHYDVEEAGAGWQHRPFEVTVTEDRIYGRGVADNLGPLWLRLLALADLGHLATPNLVMVIQGEEEIGSPSAHRIYPTLELPEVDLWIEETGYFELDGRQRLLVRRPDTRTTSWIEAGLEVARASGRGVDCHDRYLNKAFGEQRCPFLTHLVGETPYLAIGPNDPASRIHQSDESLPVCNLDLSVRQFQAVLRAAAAPS